MFLEVFLQAKNITKERLKPNMGENLRIKQSLTVESSVVNLICLIFYFEDKRNYNV